MENTIEVFNGLKKENLILDYAIGGGIAYGLHEKFKKRQKRIIEIRKDKRVTLDKIFRMKEKFHRESARLPFEKKIEILMRMWKIAELK